MAEDHSQSRFLVNPYVLPSVFPTAIIPYTQAYTYQPYYPAPHYFYDSRHNQHAFFLPGSPQPTSRIALYDELSDIAQNTEPDPGPLLYSFGIDDYQEEMTHDCYETPHPQEVWNRSIKRGSQGGWQEEPIPKKSRMDDLDDLPFSSLGRSKTFGYGEMLPSSDFDRYAPLPHIDYGHPVDTSHQLHEYNPVISDTGPNNEARYSSPQNNHPTDHYDQFVVPACATNDWDMDHDSGPIYRQPHDEDHTYSPTSTAVRDESTPTSTSPLDMDDFEQMQYSNLAQPTITMNRPTPASTPPSFRLLTPPAVDPPTEESPNSLPGINANFLPPSASAAKLDEKFSERGLEEGTMASQWRVGKTPGHQGSHVRKDDEESQGKRGEKRTLGEVRQVAGDCWLHIGSTTIKLTSRALLVPQPKSSRNHFRDQRSCLLQLNLLSHLKQDLSKQSANLKHLSVTTTSLHPLS